tara:strand:+ start:39416 stop:41767 length:2352 start_codon:yes stop_codon:yes gene_type:complete
LRIFLTLTFFCFILSCSTKNQLHNLIDEVEVFQDNNGINHIYANNQEDLFFMQGYLAAKDRLFQFEIWRRQATGTVSEILGADELERDIGTRLFKFRGNIEDESNHYHDDGYKIITSYVNGVNAYIDEVNKDPDKLPIEFTLLNIKPELWTPEVVISRHQGLLGNITQELNIGRAVSRIGEKKVKDLMWFHPKEPSLKLHKKIRKEDLEKDILALYNAYRRPIRFKKEHIVEKYRRENNKEISFNNQIDKMDEFSIGSNNWAISGSKSKNGYPILANDPHRTIVGPSLRYISHLVAPGWNVIGGGEPEIPGISIGHNEFGAWGLTVFRTDAEDLYVYEINPNNFNEYKHNGEWNKFMTIEESIPVKGMKDQKVILYYSIHGPVTLIDSVENRAYAVRCGWLEIGGSPYLASLRMNQSRTWEEFRDACNYSNIPGENMVWADKMGNIGWQAVGIAPIRNNHSGMVPVLGNGDYEWDGYLPIIEKPNIYNPIDKFFATANQNVTSETYTNWNAIGFSWSDPYRGDRVNDVLKSNTSFTMDDMKRLQVDYHSLPSEELTKMLSKVNFNKDFKEYISMLENWDNKLLKNSVEATIYVNFERKLISSFNKEYVPKEVRNLLWVQLYRIIEKINSFEVNDRNNFLKKVFISSLQDLKNRLGDNVDEWIYGQSNYKHIKISHLLDDIVNDSIGKIISFKTYPRGGNGYTPGSTSSSLNQSSGASFRVIIDTKDWDNSIATNSPGQSGNPESPFYRNLYESWANDEYFKLLYSKSLIENNSYNNIVYYPKK